MKHSFYIMKKYLFLSFFISFAAFSQTANNSTSSNIPIGQSPNNNAKPPTSLIKSYDPFFEAKERAKFWREKGYIFDSSHMTVYEMNNMAKAIDRAKYWEERGFKFDSKTMTDYEMDNMVRAYEKAHNISAQKP